MKAIIFAAGLGTRLRPLTYSKPKALIEINKIPLLEIVIKKLKFYGFNDIIINVHHFAEQIIDFLKQKNNFDINISISDETDFLLDTGGGLKKTEWFFNDNKPFLVHNVDILSNIDLKQLYEFHTHSNALVTLAVMNRQTSRYLLFDDNNQLCGWKNIKADKTRIVKTVKKYNTSLIPLAFSGIHIINPSIFDLIKEKGKFSIIDVYLRLAKDNKILGFSNDNFLWIDVGKKENLIKAANMIDKFEDYLDRTKKT